MGVRTRFAPSPTGVLHIGSVRTALFAYLYAKRHQGEFILRIEDTDRERSTEESVNAILEGMSWLNLNADEGPYYQMDRLDRYKEVIDKLLEKGLAYRCRCSKERLEALREEQLKNKQKPKYDAHCRELSVDDSEPYVIRFKNPKSGHVSFVDEVYGAIDVSNEELDDVIIQRSDGLPTYNFAVVIDDSDMLITHVIRGDDHLSNTPRQINIYHAIGASVPKFAHLPMILGEDGKRLSKRHGAVGVMEFREQGFLPWALLNYLVRLGWSQGDQEIFSYDEVVSAFELQDINRGNSSFNYDKLKWLNQHYLKEMPLDELANTLTWYYEKREVTLDGGPDLIKLLPFLIERCKTLDEMVDKSLYFYQDAIIYDDKAVKKNFKPVSYEPLKKVFLAFKELKDWQEEALHQVIVNVSESLALSMGKVAQPIRVAVTGSTMSPSIDATLALIGRDRVLSRLEGALAMFDNEAN